MELSKLMFEYEDKKNESAERMNKDNNNFWGKLMIGVGVIAVGAVGAAASVLMNKDSKWFFMTQPNPYKLVCPKCDYSKVITPKSDVPNSAIDLSLCPKCNIRLEEKPIPTKENKSWFKTNFGE